MRRILFSTGFVFVLSLFMVTGAMAFGVDLDNVPDGTYTGAGEGFNEAIEVEVTVEGGEVTNIEAISQEETPEYWEDGKQTMDDIIEAQSTDVDVETGATASSEGIVEAVRDALAGEEVAEEAEEDVEEDVEEEEEEDLPETGGGVATLLPGIGGLVAAGGAWLVISRRK
ncbi:FMN-binding protein [Natranaerobius thermophilus]|uniref:LPXTG-motif cell wall anchor domain protein n=1 Tax=Natranaerobius thermophilus (strain ATCC BAA-1301 / DSM 18059 / JW/NM-WN-LF) TaxID=457570 RepID=B2A7H5_NATTJ|nr:FMN-binding protein [Natranaerobius thermophilus]ACB85684.1 LPXTG-motif cell wall anchor domain protein [Natranaerobius thermophilus JW/NM-WN-LF]